MIHFIIAVLFFFNCAVLFAKPLPVFAASPVIIGEINWAGSTVSTADEWLELWNLGAEPFPLNGYSLQGASGNSALVFRAEDTIAPHGSFLIANYSMTDAKSTLAIQADWVTTAISLPNDQLKISLIDPQGLTIDQAGDGKSPATGLNTASNKGSMIRTDSSMNGQLALAWTTASSSQNFKASVTQLGTPGICDGCLTATTTADIESVPTPPIRDGQPEAPDNISSTPTPPALDAPLDAPLISDQPIADITPVQAIDTVLEPPIIDQIEDDATSTLTTSTNAVLDETSSSTQIVTTTNALPAVIQLNEIMSHPSTGSEWIELLLQNTSTEALLNMTLEDRQSIFLRFTSSTLRQATISTSTEATYCVIALEHARLNNDGDALVLRDPTGMIVDTISFAAIKAGQTWSRKPGTTDWGTSDQPTPNAMNTFPTPPTPALVTPVIITITPTQPLIDAATSTPVTSTAVATTNKIKTATKPRSKTSTTKIVTANQPSSPITTLKQETQKLTKAKTIKTSSRATASPLRSLTLSSIIMNPSDHANIRVRVQGIVGSVPGLLAKQQFVLLSGDGRGLLVFGNTKQPSPPYGASVQITGAVNFNDSGVSLHMAAADRWTALKQQTTTTARIVDLATPSIEDLWSLVNIQGVVQSVNGSRIQLDTSDTTIIVNIRPVTQYRAGRINIGDALRVTGLVDTRGDEPMLYPRSANDIQLFPQSVKTATTKPWNQKDVPPWAPFGSAGATIAIAHGVKKIRRSREQKRLAKMLTIAGLPESTTQDPNL